jgi:hypothetical protein
LLLEKVRKITNLPEICLPFANQSRGIVPHSYSIRNVSFLITNIFPPRRDVNVSCDVFLAAANDSAAAPSQSKGEFSS